MNALITAPQPTLGFGEMERLAEAIAKSNLFGIKTKEQAIVLMAIAQAEGRHPALAARDYDIVNNRPAKKAEAMMRDFVAAGGTVEWHSLTDELADATFTHPQTGSVRIDWDMKRAMTAFGKKDMYTKFPRQMLRSRVVSEGVRTLWPLATSGMYVESEVAAMEQHDGPTIEASPEREAINDEIPMRPAAAATPRAPRKVDPTVYEAPAEKPQRTRGSFLDALEIALRDATDAEEVDRIVCSEDVMRAKETFQNGHKQRLDKLIADALAKWWTEPTDEELGEVEIAGSEKVAAG
jgi:hypothetical protein